MSRFESDPPPAAVEEPELERLLPGAGPRPPLPETELAAAREAARSALRARFGRAAGAPPVALSAPRAVTPRPGGRRLRRARWLLLAAASLVALVGLIDWVVARSPSRPAPPNVAGGEPLGTVELVDGDAVVRSPGSLAGNGSAPPRALVGGDRLPAGSTLELGAAGRVALRLVGGASLRVGPDSALRLAAADRLELVRGRIYLDSDRSTGARGPTVETPVGRFVDIGTQYEIALDAESGGARLRVREGRVELVNGRRLEATAGEELAVAKDGAETRAPFPRSGPEWSWVVESAPIPEIDGWTLGRFLAWLARESGLAVELADRAAEERAATVRVHGSVRHLEPFAAAEVVLASAGCSFAVEGERLVVRAER